MRKREELKILVSWLAVCLIVIVLTAVLSGCHMAPKLPGGEPFGEQTFTEGQVKAAYEAFSLSFRQEWQEDWRGYTVSWQDMTDGRRDADIYFTQEYTLAYCEDMKHGEYLWYDGWLYWMKGSSVACRKMDWGELGGEQWAEELWLLMGALLEQEPTELTYKHIPMSEDKRNLLTAKYRLDKVHLGKYATISAAIYSDGRCKEVGIQWQDVGELEEWDNVSIHSSFCLFEGSRSLQAERKIWSFGYDCGLTEEVLPALSVQGADREWCRSVISNMDFAELRGRAVLDEDLFFPNLSIHGLADGW